MIDDDDDDSERLINRMSSVALDHCRRKRVELLLPIEIDLQVFAPQYNQRYKALQSVFKKHLTVECKLLHSRLDAKKKKIKTKAIS
jgi:hypothetical protein